jgi:hypothetical protein
MAGVDARGDESLQAGEARGIWKRVKRRSAVRRAARSGDHATARILAGKCYVVQN